MTALFPDVLRDCAAAADRHMLRFRNEGKSDLAQYYAGRRDTFLEVLTHYQEHGVGYIDDHEVIDGRFPT